MGDGERLAMSGQVIRVLFTRPHLRWTPFEPLTCFEFRRERAMMLSPATSVATAYIDQTPRHRPKITGRELLALQLFARGYSLEQIAHLRRDGLVETLWDLQHVLDLFGVTMVSDAIAEARQRGMIA